MLKYLATKKKQIVYFIYKVTLLLSIDVDKKTVYKVIKWYILKVSNIYIKHILYLYL